MNEINIGIALSDLNLADQPSRLRVPDDLMAYAHRFSNTLQTETVFFELQPEARFVNLTTYPDQFQGNLHNPWLKIMYTEHALQRFLRSDTVRIGLHMPTTERDPLSSNFYAKYRALEETKRVMDLAQAIQADYMVFHLATRDKWTWERTDQVNKGLKIYKEIAAYYASRGYTFTPLIEVLPYPRFPAHGGELLSIFNQAQHILHNTRIAFNISHLWQTYRRLMSLGQWDERVSFLDHLEYSLSNVCEMIHVIQLGGCWESETHAIPGLHPQQNPFDSPLKLRESPGIYAESGEINLNAVLDLVVKYTLGVGRPLHLILDIRDRDISQVLEAARQIRADILQRVRERFM